MRLGQSQRPSRAFSAGATRAAPRPASVRAAPAPRTSVRMAAANGSGMKRADTDDKVALINKVDCFIFDCDGVIWRGDSVIPGVPETLDMLRAAVRCCLCTSIAPLRSRAMHQWEAQPGAANCRSHLDGTRGSNFSLPFYAA